MFFKIVILFLLLQIAFIKSSKYYVTTSQSSCPTNGICYNISDFIAGPLDLRFWVKKFFSVKSNTIQNILQDSCTFSITSYFHQIKQVLYDYITKLMQNSCPTNGICYNISVRLHC